MHIKLPELTSIIYGLLVFIWGLILALYVFKFMRTRIYNKTMSILIFILAVDAFRTLFESVCFGLYFSHAYEFITNSAIYEPKYLIIPKLLNLVAAIVILFILIKHWIPKFLSDELTIKHDFLESEQRRKFALDAANIGDWDLNLQTNVANRSLIHDQCFGYETPVENWNYETFLSHVHPDDRDKVDKVYKRAMADASLYDTEFRVTWPDNTTHWLWTIGRFYFDEKIKPIRVSGILVDITDRKRAEVEHKALNERIKFLAYYDGLTGLPNKESLNSHLEAFVNASTTVKMSHAIFLMDVDNFKNINDTFGHYLGDLFIKEVAARLNTFLESGVFICRFGGDEFIFVMSDQQQYADQLFDKAKRVADKLLASMRTPFKLNGLEFFSSISIGLKLVNEDLNIIDAIKQADLAMYQAKNAGKNNIQIFDENLEKEVLYNARLEACLRNAVVSNEFELHYQPQVNAHNKIFGCEALIRWQSTELGQYVSPLEFIPLAEQTSLILPIGQWVLESACKTLTRWQQMDQLKEITLAINISAIQFKHSHFVSNLEKVLSNYHFNRANLKLELTETMLVEDVENMIKVMHQIKTMGLTISLDDFGTGYSSLSYLKAFPIDQLKIDRAFVKDILIDRNDALIAEAIIKLAQTLELETIAEGVETEAQRESLIKLGCNQFQGFLFSQALDLGDVEKFINEFDKQLV